MLGTQSFIAVLAAGPGLPHCSSTLLKLLSGLAVRSGPGSGSQFGHPEFYRSLSSRILGWGCSLGTQSFIAVLVAGPNLLYCSLTMLKLLSSLAVWSWPGLGLQSGHPEFHSSLSSHVLGWGRRLGTQSFIAVLVAGPSSPQTGAVRC